MVCRNGSSQVAGLLLSGATKVASLARSLALSHSLFLCTLFSLWCFLMMLCVCMCTLSALKARMLLWQLPGVFSFTLYCCKFILAQPQMHAGIYSLSCISRWNHSVVGLYHICLFLLCVQKSSFHYKGENVCWCRISIQCTLFVWKDCIAASQPTVEGDHRWEKRKKKAKQGWSDEKLLRSTKQ